MSNGEGTRLGQTMTATFKMTDAPKWLSHLEVTRDGDRINIIAVKRNGYAQFEIDTNAVEFFDSMAKLKDF